MKDRGRWNVICLDLSVNFDRSVKSCDNLW